ncbi:LysR substrate-binding domain-containing protein [Thermodesulfobacteriota bacterium]
MLNFTQLRVFHFAARYQNFTSAAKKLFITQPAVTAQIKLFEEYCGLKLFKKKGREICLTDQGQTLYNYTRKIFEFEEEIEKVIYEMRELKRGLLRLGTTKTYARYFMPFLMTSFHEGYPDIKIRLDEGSSLDMIHSLVELKNEVAIIAKAEDNPDVCFIPFSHEELVLILSPEHRLAGRKVLSIRDLADEPIIMKEIGSGTRKIVNELFEKHHCVPNVLMETSNTEFIKQLVLRNDGAAFVALEAVAVELKEKKLINVHLKGRPVFLDVNIAYLKNQQLSPPAQAFLDMLLKISPGENADQGIRTIMNGMLAKWN